MTVPISAGLSTQSVQVQRVVIQTVDPISQTATAMTRYSTVVTIDTSFCVGAVHVVPAVGEHWYVKRISDKWVLERKGPHGTDALANSIANPVSGLNQIGSSGADAGPLNLLGNLIFSMAPLVLDSFPTDSYPDPALAKGMLIYDSTLDQVVFSDGSAWTAITGGGGGGGSADTVIGEVPSGVANGSNTIFTTAHPFVTGTTAVYLNGLREHFYTASSSTITFDSAPQGGDFLSVDYTRSS